MLKATGLHLKIPRRNGEIKKISKIERDNHLRRFKFFLPQDEPRLRKRLDELNDSFYYPLIEDGKYCSSNRNNWFHRDDEVILFVQKQSHILEKGGKVLDQFYIAFSKKCLLIQLDEDYLPSYSGIPIYSCSYRDIYRGYRKK